MLIKARVGDRQVRAFFPEQARAEHDRKSLGFRRGVLADPVSAYVSPLSLRKMSSSAYLEISRNSSAIPRFMSSLMIKTRMAFLLLFVSR